MSILNSCVLSNAVASNSQSLRDTVSLMSEQKEMHECMSIADTVTVWAEKCVRYFLCSLEAYFWHL